MKPKQTLHKKRNEVNIVSVALFSISFHKGVGSFSTHRRYPKDFPIVLIMVSKGYAISVKTSASPAVQIHTHRCQLFFEKGLNSKLSYKGEEKWEFFEIRISPLLLRELPS